MCSMMHVLIQGTGHHLLCALLIASSIPHTHTHTHTLEAHTADNRWTLGSKLIITPWHPQNGSSTRSERTSLYKKGSYPQPQYYQTPHYWWQFVLLTKSWPWCQTEWVSAPESRPFLSPSTSFPVWTLMPKALIIIVPSMGEGRNT